MGRGRSGIRESQIIFARFMLMCTNFLAKCALIDVEGGVSVMGIRSSE